MDVLFLSQLQFAATCMFHWIFVPLTLGLSIMTAWMETRYVMTGDETWPLRLPMTKAAVRAMDTVTAFCGSPDGGSHSIDSFVVAGGSKRGWTVRPEASPQAVPGARCSARRVPGAC